ncbi:MAG TPA: type II toxin-antitoxin system RelE/ParE family toxin [Acetobacteraceae bacterium]
MPRALRYTDKALADLDAIRHWLTQAGSGPAARRRLMAIRAAISRLRQQPCLYPVGQHPGVRELPCDGGYRALYRVTPDTGHNETAGDVRVLRMFGPGQSRGRL